MRPDELHPFSLPPQASASPRASTLSLLFMMLLDDFPSPFGNAFSASTISLFAATVLTISMRPEEFSLLSSPRSGVRISSRVHSELAVYDAPQRRPRGVDVRRRAGGNPLQRVKLFRRVSSRLKKCLLMLQSRLSCISLVKQSLSQVRFLTLLIYLNYINALNALHDAPE